VITPFLEWIGAAETYEETAINIEENGFVALFLVGVTPLPFQVGAVAAGAVGMAVIPFLIAMTLSRAIRYFAESLLVMAIGHRAEDWLVKHELEIFIGGFVVLGGVIAASVLL
jgi:membrane protein YqaA with SNARE-associated domain